MSWRIEFFETERGTSPPREFLLGLSPKAQAKFARTLDLVAEYWPHIAEPYVRATAGRRGLFEVRTQLGREAYRLFFFTAAAHECLVMVHGIRKKTERTPARDLETAERRMLVYLERQ